MVQVVSRVVIGGGMSEQLDIYEHQPACWRHELAFIMFGQNRRRSSAVGFHMG